MSSAALKLHDLLEALPPNWPRPEPPTSLEKLKKAIDDMEEADYLLQKAREGLVLVQRQVRAKSGKMHWKGVWVRPGSKGAMPRGTVSKKKDDQLNKISLLIDQGKRPEALEMIRAAMSSAKKSNNNQLMTSIRDLFDKYQKTGPTPKFKSLSSPIDSGRELFQQNAEMDLYTFGKKMQDLGWTVSEASAVLDDMKRSGELEAVPGTGKRHFGTLPSKQGSAPFSHEVGGFKYRIKNVVSTQQTSAPVTGQNRPPESSVAGAKLAAEELGYKPARLTGKENDYAYDMKFTKQSVHATVSPMHSMHGDWEIKLKIGKGGRNRETLITGGGTGREAMKGADDILSRIKSSDSYIQDVFK